MSPSLDATAHVGPAPILARADACATLVGTPDGVLLTSVIALMVEA
jgi:hypothetical protein